MSGFDEPKLICWFKRTQSYRFCRSSILSLLWEKLNGGVSQEPFIMQRKFVWMGTFLRRRCREENWATYYHLNVSWPWIQMALGATFWIRMPDWRLDKRTYLCVINEMVHSNFPLIWLYLCRKLLRKCSWNEIIRLSLLEQDVFTLNHRAIKTSNQHKGSCPHLLYISCIRKNNKQNSYGWFVFYVCGPTPYKMWNGRVCMNSKT